MPAVTRIDLSHVEVVDDHSHGFRLADCLAADPAALEQRLTFLGMMYGAASAYLQPEAAETQQIGRLTSSSVFALTARRQLARVLGCHDTLEDVAAARHEALATDPRGYVGRLFAGQNLRGLIVDEGYPDNPPLARADFQSEVGVPVFRAWRIENYVLDLVKRVSESSAARLPTFADMEEGFLAALDEAARDAHTVAFKSVIAYMGGLDVGGRDRDETARAYTRWMAQGSPLEGAEAREVFGYVLRLTLKSARDHGRPVHIHCGGGDASMADIRTIAPRHLYPLLYEHRAQPIVLVHAGHPWLADAAYVAAVLPFVYLDLSAWHPWATTGADAGLQTLIGAVPTEKLLHGTDTVGEPEILWLGALLMKRTLERVFGRAVDDDFLSAVQAQEAAAGILGANTVRLHGLDPSLLVGGRPGGGAA